MHGIIYKATSPTGKAYVGQTVKTLKDRKKPAGFETISVNSGFIGERVEQ